MEIPERYVQLCLRLGRHLDGFIDAYAGPAEWSRAVEAEEPVGPATLRNEADLLLTGLDAADLEEDRRRWLRPQLGAVRCLSGRLAGEELAWSDVVERCLGVRPTRTDAAEIERIHRRLDAALPGGGGVRERYTAWETDNAIPRDRLIPALERLQEVLRPRAREIAPLPEDESVAYELVSDVPWIAYAWYEGDLRSRVQINADLPVSIVLLVDIAAHESYPGHHTERTAKDARLTRELGRIETSVAIAPAPESVISEGIGTNALAQALGPQPFETFDDALRGLGVRFEPAEALEVHLADLAMYGPATNAAFMLHEDGASADEVEGYMREVALDSDEKAPRSVAFLTDPASSAYISAYQDGRRLCGAFAERAPGNFSRLLTEQLTPADLIE